MSIGVSVIDIASGQAYNAGNQASYIAASITKLLTACLFMYEVERGGVTLQTSINEAAAQDELRLMIVESNNSAWRALNTKLGRSKLKTYANSVGITSYDATGNTICCADIALLLHKLYTHQLLNKIHTELLLSYMKEASETSYIVSAAPKNATVYHKAGWLTDRVHDAAIVESDNQAYVLVIFSKTIDSNDYDTEAGKLLFHEVTRLTNDVLL